MLLLLIPSTPLHLAMNADAPGIASAVDAIKQIRVDKQVLKLCYRQQHRVIHYYSPTSMIAIPVSTHTYRHTQGHSLPLQLTAQPVTTAQILQCLRGPLARCQLAAAINN
jgi:hypothetical protein